MGEYGSCSHQPDDEGVCVLCSFFVGCAGREPRRSVRARSTTRRLGVVLELPPDILSGYERIHAIISGVEAEEVKASFYALYHAYLEGKAPQPPELIAKLVGLPVAKICSTFTKFKEAKTGYRPPDTRLLPRYYALPYFEVLELSAADLQPCIDICDHVASVAGDLVAEHPPQKICAAVIFHYRNYLSLPVKLTDSRGFNEKAFSDLVNLSLSSLKILSKILAKFLPEIHVAGPSVQISRRRLIK